MASQPPRSRSFGPFLEAMQQQAPQKASAPSGGGAPDLVVPLKALADAGPLSVPQLQETTGLDLVAFAELLEGLKKAKLVDVSGVPGHETVELTDAGRAIAEAGFS